MNNKLLKRLLMTTALGAASIGGIINVLAATPVPANTVVETTGLLLADDPFNVTGGGATVKLNHNPAAVGGLPTVTIDLSNGGAGIATNTKIEINAFGGAAQDYVIAALENEDATAAKAEIIFTAASNLNITASQDRVASVDFGAFESILTLNDAATIDSVKGTKGKFVSKAGNVIVTAIDDTGIDTFEKDAAGATLTIVGKSKALGGGYKASDGSLLIQNDATGAFSAVAADTAIQFDAINNSIIATGDATLSDANAHLVFHRTAAVAGERNITFTGNVIANNDGDGIVSVVGDNGGVNAVITGNVGTGTENVAEISLESNNVGNVASLTLQGNSWAADYKYNALSVLTLDSGAGKKAVTHTGVFTAAAGATLKTIGSSDVTIDGTIDNGALVVGTANGASTIVKGAIGENNPTTIQFTQNGAILDAQAGVISVSPVDFRDTGSTIKVGADSIFGAITNAASSTITVTGDFDLELGAVGDVNDRTKLLKIDASAVKDATKTVSVVNDSMFDAIDTGAGSLIYGNAVTAISVKEIKGGRLTVNNEDLTINALGSDNNTSVIQSGTVNFADNHSLTVVGNFGIFASKVTTAAGGQGTLVLDGSGTITSTVLGTDGHALDGLNFVGGKNSVVTLDTKNAKHYITALNVGNGTVRFASSYNLTGDFTAEGTLDLGKSVLTATGAVTLDGATLIVNDGGRIVGNLADADKITLTIAPGARGTNGQILIASKADNGPMAIQGDTEVIVTPGTNLVANDGYAFLNDKGVNITGNAADANKLVATRDLDDDKVKAQFAAESSSIIGNLKSLKDSILASNVAGGSDAANFMLDAGDAKDSKGFVSYVASALPRNLAETQKNIIRATESAYNATQSVISARMNAAGAADDLKPGSSIWVKGTFGKGSQEASDLYPSSYDSSLFGGTIGAEFGLGDFARVGAAGSYTQTTITYKGLRTDEDKFKSVFGSLYGFANFQNNVVLNGSLTFGSSKIDGKTVNSNTGVSSDDAQLNALSYGGSILAGYKADVSSLSVTPLVGVGFSQFENPARKTADGKGSVKATDTNRVDLIAGLSIASEIKSSDMIIVPEIHGFVNYNIRGDSKQASIDMQGAGASNSLSYLAVEATKANFTVGGSLTAKSGIVEYGASVDGQFADKYWGVLGALKLKVNL